MCAYLSVLNGGELIRRGARRGSLLVNAHKLHSIMQLQITSDIMPILYLAFLHLAYSPAIFCLSTPFLDNAC